MEIENIITLYKLELVQLIISNLVTLSEGLSCSFQLLGN